MNELNDKLKPLSDSFSARRRDIHPAASIIRDMQKIISASRLTDDVYKLRCYNDALDIKLRELTEIEYEVDSNKIYNYLGE